MCIEQKEEAQRLVYNIWKRIAWGNDNTTSNKVDFFVNEFLCPDIDCSDYGEKLKLNNRFLMGGIIYNSSKDETKDEIINNVKAKITEFAQDNTNEIMENQETNTNKNRYDRAVNVLNWLSEIENSNKKKIGKSIKKGKWCLGLSGFTVVSGIISIVCAITPLTIIALVLAILNLGLFAIGSVGLYADKQNLKNVEKTVKQINSTREELGLGIEINKDVDEGNKKKILGKDSRSQDAIERSAEQMNQGENQQNQINLPLIP